MPATSENLPYFEKQDLATLAPMEFITDFDGSDEEDVVDTKRKPAYVRQLAMVDEPEMPVHPLGSKTKED